MDGLMNICRGITSIFRSSFIQRYVVLFLPNKEEEKIIIIIISNGGSFIVQEKNILYSKNDFGEGDIFVLKYILLPLFWLSNQPAELFNKPVKII